MKKLAEILCIPAILLAGNVFSQQVIATAGSTGTGTGIELSWTIGEPVTATAPGSGFIFTQGFQQGQPALQTDDQTISLFEGWNIISARVIPEYKTIDEVFQQLILSGQLIKVMDEAGRTLEDWGVFGGWQNGIGDLSSTEGYNVKVKSPTSFLIEGSKYLFPFHINLTTGWNMISWPAAGEQNGMDVFNTLISEGKLIKVMDEAGNTIEDWGVFGGWKNNITNLRSGEGYKVKVKNDCTLVINENGIKSEIVLPASLAATHFIPEFRGNGTDHMNIHLVNLNESGIIAGDEIGIFDSELCVGSAKVGIQSSSISIPVSANDGLEGKNGFNTGNTITARLFRNGVEYPVELQPLSNTGAIYQKGGSLFAQVELSTGVIALNNFIDVKCYPNPFSELLAVEILTDAKQKFDVSVYDIKGARIKSLFKDETEGKHTVYWDGRNQAGARMISGTYFIRVNDLSFKVLLEQLTQ